MSYSHDLYKKYKKAEDHTNYLKRIGSNYVKDAKKDEEIARLRYEAEDRRSREEFDRTNRLFDFLNGRD